MSEGINQSNEQYRQQGQQNSQQQQDGSYDEEQSQSGINQRPGSGSEGSNAGVGGMNQQSDVGQPGYGSSGQGGMTSDEHDSTTSGALFRDQDSSGEPSRRTMGDGNPENIGIPSSDYDDESDNEGMTATGGMPNVDR